MRSTIIAAFSILWQPTYICALPASFDVNDPTLLTLPSNNDIGQIRHMNFSTPATPAVVQFCDRDQTKAINSALFNAETAAKLAERDARSGVNSFYGFRAMFKSSQAVTLVRFLTNQIYQYNPLQGLRPRPTAFEPPIFVCVAQDTAPYYQYLNLPYDMWQKCERPSRDGRPPQAFYADDTPFIFVCHSFFNQEAIPPGSLGNKGCPDVVNNQFIGNANIFYKDYQMYTVLYQLIRFYLGWNSLTPSSTPKEVFDWNLCVRFSMDESIKNPTNFLLYIAMVAQQCMAEPDPKQPPFGPSWQYAADVSTQLQQNSTASLGAITTSIALIDPSASQDAIV